MHYGMGVKMICLCIAYQGYHCPKKREEPGHRQTVREEVLMASIKSKAISTSTVLLWLLVVLVMLI